MLVCCERVYKVRSGWLAEHVNSLSLSPDDWEEWSLQGIGGREFKRVWQYYICFPMLLQPYSRECEICGIRIQNYLNNDQETLFETVSNIIGDYMFNSSDCSIIIL